MKIAQKSHKAFFTPKRGNRNDNQYKKEVKVFPLTFNAFYSTYVYI